jgi:purine-binding chemotaxis protein CheW
MAETAGQYLSFTLDEEHYAIEILRIQEIRGYSGITPIPNTPPYVRGVMNLRGTVIPVVDLRARFSMAPREYNKFTVVIVVTMGERIAGLVVDAVSDVLEIPASGVRPAPDFGARSDMRFIAGMTEAAGKLVVLLEIDRLLGEDEAGNAGSVE